MQKLVSVDFSAYAGLLRKPDINKPLDHLYLTFNFLHKPALLGILGSIVGLDGFNLEEKTPQYLRELGMLKIGIIPLRTVEVNFEKMVISYNNSTGLATDEKGGNLVVKEQTLVQPKYRVYLLLSFNNPIEKKLYNYLKEKQAEFLPYLGKNEFPLYWDNWQEYQFETFLPNSAFKVESIFYKETLIKDTQTVNDLPEFSTLGKDLEKESDFAIFERLPIAYKKAPFQYDYRTFVYTNYKLNKNAQISSLYKILPSEYVIQLF